MFTPKSKVVFFCLVSLWSVICFVECAKKPGRCDPDEFRCKTGECIPDVWKCDGEPDCSNKRDEKKCPVFQCGDYEHLCTDNGAKHCIPISYRCDEDPDCEDRSDEDPAICRAARP